MTYCLACAKKAKLPILVAKHWTYGKCDQCGKKAAVMEQPK